MGPGGRRVIWTRYLAPNQSVVVLDGVACKPINAWRSLSPPWNSTTSILRGINFLAGSLWSPDGKHVAWLAVRGSKCILVVDGVESEPWDNLRNGVVSLSADWSRVGFVAEDGKKTFAVLDGKKLGGEFDEVESIVISPDGRRVALQAIRERKRILLVDGQQVGGEYREALGPVFSPDSKRVIFQGRSDKGTHLVVDGVSGSPYDSIRSIVFSPDGRRIAYEARINPLWHVIVDGKSGPPAEELGGSLKFSPDGKHLAYFADNQLVLDGQVQPKAISTLGWAEFSPDGSRIAYFRNTHFGGIQVEVDGVTYGASVTNVVFSPNSRHIAFVERWRFVQVDRSPGVEVDAVVGPPTFSPDDKKVAYPIRRGREIRWKVDPVVSELGAGSPEAIQEFGKVRSVIENSESLRLMRTIRSISAQKDGKPAVSHQETILIKGELVKIVVESTDTGAQIVSNGTTVEIAASDSRKGAVKRSTRPATPELREDLCKSLSHGITLVQWMYGKAQNPRALDLKPMDLRDGKKGLSYILMVGESGRVSRIELWYDPKTYAISKRTVQSNEGHLSETIHESFEEFSIKPVLPDSEFQLSPEKK